MWAVTREDAKARIRHHEHIERIVGTDPQARGWEALLKVNAILVRTFRDGTVTREVLPLWLARWTLLAIPENEPQVARARLVQP